MIWAATNNPLADTKNARDGAQEPIRRATAGQPEGLARIRAARTKHGGYSAEIRQVAAMIRALKTAARRLLVELS